MVGADKETVTTLVTDNLLQQQYINYPGMGVYFNYWIQHFMPDCRNISDRSLHHAGEMNSIEGAILMVVGGLGISVFPRHCVQQHIDAGKLFVFEQAGTDVLLNTIYIVSRNQPAPPARVETVIQWFMDMH